MGNVLVHKLKTTVLAILGVLSCCLTLLTAPTAEAADEAPVTWRKLVNPTETVAGADRFETAVKLSQRAIWNKPKVVFLVNGYSFADALAAGPAAANLEAPILLTMRDSMPSVVEAELKRLNPERVYLIGSESAVAETVKSQLAKALPQVAISRVGGANRHDTAAQIAQMWFPDAQHAYVASGWKFPDAISAGAAGAARNVPVLLTAPGQLAAETATFLRNGKTTKITIVGSEAALPKSIASALSAARPAAQVDRVGGANRYETNALLMQDVFGTWPGQAVMVTTGENFPDALAAAQFVNLGIPILLSTPTCMVPASRSALERFLPFTHDFIIRAGNSVKYKAWNTECGTGQQYEAPLAASGTTVTRPAGIDSRDISAETAYSFYGILSERLTGTGKDELPASRVYISTGTHSAWTIKQLQAATTGNYDPLAGAPNSNEANHFMKYEWYSDPGSIGAYAPLNWWYGSKSHQIVFNSVELANINRCIVYNAAEVVASDGTRSALANAAWTDCATAKRDGVVVTTLDTRFNS